MSVVELTYAHVIVWNLGLLEDSLYFVDCRLPFSNALMIVFMEVIPVFYFSVYGWIQLLQLLGFSLVEINTSCGISLA